MFNGITVGSAIYLQLIGFFAVLMALIVESVAFAILQYIHRLQHELADDSKALKVITANTSISSAA